MNYTIEAPQGAGDFMACRGSNADLKLTRAK